MKRGNKYKFLILLLSFPPSFAFAVSKFIIFLRHPSPVQQTMRLFKRLTIATYIGEIKLTTPTHARMLSLDQNSQTFPIPEKKIHMYTPLFWDVLFNIY